MPKRTDDLAESVDLRDQRGKPKSMRAKPTLPAPPGVNVPAPKLFGWADSFSEAETARAVFHFYRDYPVINRQLIGESKPKLIALFDNSEGARWTHSKTWEEFILKNQEWGGSGKYKVIVTELGVAGAICMSKFKIEDGDYPPRVDPRIVVMGHPDNKGYIEGRRAEGIRFPGDDPEADRIEQEEQDEMTVATEVVGVLKDALREQREDSAELREQVDRLRESGPSTESTATNTAVQVVAEGAKAAISMIAKQADKAQPQPFDPVEIFKVGLGARGEDNSLAVAKLFMDSQEKTLERVQAMHHETMQTFEKLTHEDDEPASTAVTTATSGNPLLDKMREMKEFAELMGWKTGRSAEPVVANPEPSIWDKIGKFASDNPAVIMTGLTTSLALIANICHNIRSKTPQDPKDALAAAAQLPTSPAAQPAQPTPEQQMAKFMEFFTPHFLNHYSGGAQGDMDGYTLAADMHTLVETPNGIQVLTGHPATAFGTDQYQKMRGAGPANFDRMLRNWPPIWNTISNSPHTPSNPERYAQFMKEFFTYEEWAKQQQQAEESNIHTIRPS